MNRSIMNPRRLIAWMPLIVLNHTGAMETRDPDPFEADRMRMVEQQIQKRGIRDARVLAAMRKVPRHRFVPVEVAAYAYEDEPLPIGHGQTISQPYIVAYMTEILRLKGGEKVLEIGTGSGYQAAILAEIVGDVYTVEIVKPLADRARASLDRLGYKNIHYFCGDGYSGWPSAAPFDAVIVTAAPAEVPLPLFEQLREGGRLVLPVGELWQELVVITKRGGKMERHSLIPVRFVPLTREPKRPK
jgi:protein-L-isoaspartate(D-aspartate) O-methyltransferase